MTMTLRNPTAKTIRTACLLAALAVMAGLGLASLPSAAEEAHMVPAPTQDEPAGKATSEVAVLAGGAGRPGPAVPARAS